MLDESQWWPAERLLAWQRQLLQLLLTHARATSPFYKFRLNRVFRANGTIDWDRWQDIPILTRADLFGNFDSLRSVAPVAEHGPFRDVRSSGSTGHPVTMRTSRWLLDMAAACNWRAQRWAGLDWSKSMLVTMGETPSRKVGDSLGPWGPPWLATAGKGRLIYTHYLTEYADRLALIARDKAAYHTTTAFAAEMLVDFVERTGAGVQLEALLCRGSSVTPSLRDALRRVFGAGTVEFYSSKEGGALAQACPQGHGFHINAETVLLEVVDADGRPTAPGEKGRAVITPFGSTAMPLIRYDQGDTVVAGTTCSCGRTLPMIEAVSGREKQRFRHPDGRERSRELPESCWKMIGAGQLQIAQVGPTNYEIRYTPHNWGDPRDEAGFVRVFREIFFEDSQVRFVELPEVPLTPSGKFRATVVEWDPSSVRR